MNTEKIITHITGWLKNYSVEAGTGGYVVGISGGIDSALTSVLCAMTGQRVIAVTLPIRQGAAEFERATEHIRWLKTKFDNVETDTIDMSEVLTACESVFPKEIQEPLVMANTRARLRMIALYALATRQKLLVAGTGNKVEDFGVGFFTKYGDGGVDVSPIADLYKTEVYQLSAHLGVASSIQNAAPTDGLFENSPSDEEQIGASYPELEWAMEYLRKNEHYTLNDRQNEVMKIYKSRHLANLHKINPIPVCLIPSHLKEE